MLDAIKLAVGGTAATLRMASADAVAHRQIMLGFEPAFEKAYHDHYWREDVCASRWPVGRTATADTLVPPEVRRDAAMFHELCVPFHLDDMVGGLVESSPTGTIALSIMKPRGRRPFDDRHTALLDTLVPHLRRAAHINGALQVAESDRAFAWDVIDRLPVGVFAVDVAGRVRNVNRAGERMLGNGLRLGSDGLVAEHPAATRGLRACLAAARTADASAPLAIALPRKEGPPLGVLAMPAARGGALGLGSLGVDVLLVVTDPSARVDPPASLLTRVYGLTAAEARVALLLGRGLAPKEVANELGTAWNTVRFQLRQVYAKTRTSGQSALVRLLSLLGVVGQEP